MIWKKKKKKNIKTFITLFFPALLLRFCNWHRTNFVLLVTINVSSFIPENRHLKQPNRNFSFYFLLMFMLLHELYFSVSRPRLWIFKCESRETAHYLLFNGRLIFQLKKEKRIQTVKRHSSKPNSKSILFMLDSILNNAKLSHWMIDSSVFFLCFFNQQMQSSKRQFILF